MIYNVDKAKSSKRMRDFNFSNCKDVIGVREGGAGGASPPPNFLRIYLFGQKLSCHSGNDGLVVRRIY